MSIAHLPTPTTCWTEVENNLCEVIAELPSFQTFCGASSAMSAVNHVWMEQLPEPANGEAYNEIEKTLYNAHAIVSSNSYGRSQLGDNDFNHYGGMLVLFGRLIDHTELKELDVIMRTFKNQLGAMPGELLAYTNQHGGIAARQFEFPSNTSFLPKRSFEKGYEMVRAELKITWQSY